MSLKKYITESERAHQLPVTGDVIQAIVNEEIALEFDVVGHSDDGFCNRIRWLWITCVRSM